MEFGMKVSLLIILFFVISANAHSGLEKCRYPAIFNFGDSNSDTGGIFALTNDVVWPNGMTLGKPSKRFSDGRLIIDFIAESFGLPYLNSTLDKNGTSYRYGANFAVGGQRVNPGQIPGSNFWANHLDEQINRFFTLKSLASASRKLITSIYPKPSAFKKALYTIDIGQNDVGSYFIYNNASQVLDYFTVSVKRLLNDGARYMWIHNTCPWGCLPAATENCPNWLQPTCTLDKYGCITEHNERSQRFNTELEKRVHLLRKQYPKAVITLVDMYSAKHSLLDHINGFDDGSKLKYCCGEKGVSCGHPSIPSKENNWKTTFGNACKDPSKYLSWDGVHYTEAANKYVAKLISNGQYSEPRVGLSQSCIKQ